MRIRRTGIVVATVAAMLSLAHTDRVAAQESQIPAFGSDATKDDIMRYLLSPSPTPEAPTPEAPTSEAPASKASGATRMEELKRKLNDLDKTKIRGGTLVPVRPETPNPVTPAKTTPVCTAADKAFASPVEFATGSYYLEKTTLVMLGTVAEVMRDPSFDDCMFVVQGHTDSTGDAYKNVILSQNRAGMVGEYLVSSGIPRSRIIMEGKGSTAPRNPANPAAGENRRVEFFFANPY